MSEQYPPITETDRLRIDLGITGQEPENDCDPLVRLRHQAEIEANRRVISVDEGDIWNE